MKAKEKGDCYFYRENGACGILTDTSCDGYKAKCTFRKTKSEYVAEKDSAIMKCRHKGLCRKCKYIEASGILCKLSTE